jgi:hypothetical protein
MRQNAIRIRAAAKRRFLKVINFQPALVTSIYRKEGESRITSEQVSKYTKSSFIEIPDPRNGQLVGHYFQEREVLRLFDVVLEPRQGFVYDKNGFLVAESTSWNSYFAYLCFPWTPRRFIPDLKIDNAIPLASNSYWHWLIEDLPTTIAAMKIFPNSPLLVAKNPPKYVLDFIETIDCEVIFLNGPVKVKSLILVVKQQDSGWPDPGDISTLLEYGPFAQALECNGAPRKIYASRKFSRRSPENEEEIENWFSSKGFEIHYLERMNLLEEIKLLGSTDFLVGIHGAGLANIIWMNKKSKLIDLVSKDYWTESVHRLSHIKEISYNGIALNELDSSLSFLSPKAQS